MFIKFDSKTFIYKCMHGGLGAVKLTWKPSWFGTDRYLAPYCWWDATSDSFRRQELCSAFRTTWLSSGDPSPQFYQFYHHLSQGYGWARLHIWSPWLNLTLQDRNASSQCAEIAFGRRIVAASQIPSHTYSSASHALMVQFCFITSVNFRHSCFVTTSQGRLITVFLPKIGVMTLPEHTCWAGYLCLCVPKRESKREWECE